MHTTHFNNTVLLSYLRTLVLSTTGKGIPASKFLASHLIENLKKPYKLKGNECISISLFVIVKLPVAMILM